MHSYTCECNHDAPSFLSFAVDRKTEKNAANEHEGDWVIVTKKPVLGAYTKNNPKWHQIEAQERVREQECAKATAHWFLHLLLAFFVRM